MLEGKLTAEALICSFAFSLDIGCALIRNKWVELTHVDIKATSSHSYIYTTSKMLPTSRCCRPRCFISSLLSRIRRRDKTRECISPSLHAKLTSTYISCAPSCTNVSCTESLGRLKENGKFRRFHSAGEDTNGEDEVPARTVTDYSLDELLDRIAEAQLKTDERIADTTGGRRKKQRAQRKRATPMDIDELVSFLRQEAARDICVIKIPPEREYVDYFIVCSGLGIRHVRAMADNLVREVGNGSVCVCESESCDLL